jgi:hypothetical protein
MTNCALFVKAGPGTVLGACVGSRIASLVPHVKNQLFKCNTVGLQMLTYRGKQQ